MEHNDRNHETRDETTADRTTAAVSRRDVLRATATGALATATGISAVGSASAKGAPTPHLHRDGNLIKDPTGHEVTLRGVNTADPKRLDVTAPARGKNAEQVIDLATDESEGWHANVVRLPVQPVDIGEHPPGQGPAPVAFTQGELERYIRNHLDPAVWKCKQEGAYAIVDYHRHRNIQWTSEDLAEEVQLFWETVAKRYGNKPHVLFEVYNEPQTPGMWGPITNGGVQDVWHDWKTTAQPWVDTIREHAPKNPILIGSPSWSQSPEGALIEEFDGDNLAYTYHIYPGHGISENEAWDDDASWANGGQGTNKVYEEVPLFVTEWGYEPNAGPYVGGTTEGFGKPFRDWLESGPIHWTAWNFDPIWAPTMWDRDFETEPTGNPYDDSDGPVPTLCEDDPCDWTLQGGQYQGQFVKDFLADKRNDGVPNTGNGKGNGN